MLQLRSLYEKAIEKMILYAILAGFYALGMSGYYKMSRNLMMGDEDTKAIMGTYPKIYKGMLGLLSLGWPVMIYWQLVKEASK